MNDEEVAFRIVRLYFEDVARLGFKRQLDLDQMINAYFYTLKKLKNKDESMKKIVAEIKKAEEDKKTETSTVTKTVETKTTISTQKSPPQDSEETTQKVPLKREKTITEIIEEK
ncbi:MAG: hypothetical protein GX950_03610 [Candidatus Diapherotrites archaeon]|jgi:hypothetical protein|uniref:Uncharacterized protein n=1 Tax=Candidatus Iainarchaeum sp. TaxID=3101447 RepID=A0A7K4C0M3_9ARCH|nr:hypothetical protein [Candidatus Diapherotrites archaeon]